MRRSLLGLFAAAFTLVALPSPANAEGSAKEFIQEIDGKSTPHLMILNAYGHGMMTMAVAYEQEGISPYYCPPKKMVMTPEQTAEILREFIKDKPNVAELPASIALLFAFKSTFPCS